MKPRPFRTRSATRLLPRAVHVVIGLALAPAMTLLALFVRDAPAADLVGASHSMRATQFSSGVARLDATSMTTVEGSGVGAGQAGIVGFSGSTADLTTIAPGFWPIVAGALPALDLDGDLQQGFLDEDDDGDGLDDVVETGTQVFVSEFDTGTSAVLFDSDGDGINDGAEVAAGSDPNDPESVPGVPALGLFTQVLLATLLLSTAVLAQRRFSFATDRRH